MDTSGKNDTIDKTGDETMKTETVENQSESPQEENFTEESDQVPRESVEMVTTDDENLSSRPFLDNLEENYDTDSVTESAEESDDDGTVELDDEEENDDEVICLSDSPAQTSVVSRPHFSTNVYNPIQLRQEGYLPTTGKIWVLFRSQNAIGIQMMGDPVGIFVYRYVSPDCYECESCKLKSKVSRLILINKQPAYEKSNHVLDCFAGSLITCLRNDYKKLMEKSFNEPIKMATVVIPPKLPSKNNVCTRVDVDKVIDALRKLGSELQDVLRYDIKSRGFKERSGYTIPKGKEGVQMKLVCPQAPPPEPSESEWADISSRLRKHPNRKRLSPIKKKPTIRRSVRQTAKVVKKREISRYSPQPPMKTKQKDLLIPYCCPLTMENELPSSLYQIRKIDSETSELIEIMSFNVNLCRVYISDMESIGKHYQQYYCRHCSKNPPCAYHFKTPNIVLAPPSEKHQCGPLKLDNVLNEQSMSIHRKRTKSRRLNSVSKKKQDIIQEFTVPAHCPLQKSTRIPKYDWYFRQIGGITSYEWLFVKVGDTEKAYDLLEDACDDGFYSYCCRDCRVDTVKAVYLKTHQEVLALSLIEHDCCCGLPHTVEAIPSSIITKEDRLLLSIPDNLWILPCDENNVAKKKLYLVSENNFRKGKEFIIEAKKINDDVMYVCNYCITQNHTVYAMVCYENGRIYIDAEKSHLSTCPTIHLADLLAEETKILVNSQKN